MMNEQQQAAEPGVREEMVGRLLDGEITLGQFIGLSSEDLYRMAQVGYELIKAGKLDEAKRIYAGLVAADPYDSVFRCHLGAIHHRLGELDDAIHEYTASIRFNIANVDALTGRGMVYLMRKEFVPAVQDLQAAVALDTDGSKESARAAQVVLQTLKQTLASEAARASQAGANAPSPNA